MRYHGGKSKIATSIASVILNTIQKERELVSLFCGTCSVEAKLAPHFEHVVCNDKHEYLIEMLRGVQNGYELPESITEEQWRYIKDHRDEDKVLTGFVGFGCSFGGRWFEGYARDRTGTNYAAQSKRSLLKDMAYLENADFICGDYHDAPIETWSVIYADPPYFGTKVISRTKFDTDLFWDYAREISQTNRMFISELTAPNDFISIWEAPVTRGLNSDKTKQFKSQEKLFVYKKWI